MHNVYSYAFYKFMDEASLLKKTGFITEAFLKEEEVNAHEEYEYIVRFANTDKDWKKIIRRMLKKHEQGVRSDNCSPNCNGRGRRKSRRLSSS